MLVFELTACLFVVHHQFAGRRRPRPDRRFPPLGGPRLRIRTCSTAVTGGRKLGLRSNKNEIAAPNGAACGTFGEGMEFVLLVNSDQIDKLGVVDHPSVVVGNSA